MNIQLAIQQGTNILTGKRINTAKLDAEILMAKTLKKDRKFIILNNNKDLEDKNLKYFNKLIKERASRKPIAHLTNKKFFWNNEFFINKNTLIPRPDTEVIVEQVLKLTKHKNMMNILDIGVGSGCILLSILKERKNFYGTGIDISKNALDICKINAKRLKVDGRTKFYKSDIDNFDNGKYDLIISNPPYIKRTQLKYLEKDVVGFEPKHALDGGIEGLSEIRKVINKSSELIKKKGHLVLEIGFDQKRSVKEILEKKGFYIKKIVKDLSNIDRCIISIKI